MRILLLQVRSRSAAAAHEQICFQEALGVESHELVPRCLVRGPRLREVDLEGFDAILVGGAGECSASQEYDFSPWLEDGLYWLLEREVPLFGSCWGHQFLGRILGGGVVTAPQEEIGTYPVTLTEAGRGDPLFADLPPTLDVQLGHHEQIVDPPTELEVLASSPRCLVQAFRVRGKPAYGTQFHPELDLRRLTERLDLYADSYWPEPGAGLRETPDASTLLKTFLKVFVSTLG